MEDTWKAIATAVSTVVLGLISVIMMLVKKVKTSNENHDLLRDRIEKLEETIDHGLKELTEKLSAFGERLARVETLTGIDRKK